MRGEKLIFEQFSSRSLSRGGVLLYPSLEVVA